MNGGGPTLLNTKVWTSQHQIHKRTRGLGAKLEERGQGRRKRKRKSRVEGGLAVVVGIAAQSEKAGVWADGNERNECAQSAT